MTALNPRFTVARYTPSSNPDYAGNPFIEHLGELPDDKEISKALTKLPRFDVSLRRLPGPQRIDRLSGLQNICVPLPRLVKLARAMLKLMRAGYEPRKPYSRTDNETVKRLFGAQKDGFERTILSTPPRVKLARQISMSLVGASGCGKSFGLSHVTGLVDEVIYHEQYGKWQLPFLFIEMSYDGESVHTLASELFRELDRLLPDAGYTDLYMNRKGLNAQQRLAKALALCYEHGAGMLIVDEAQSQRSIGNEGEGSGSKRRATDAKNETPLMKLLIAASNTSHFPLLFSGTLEMQNIVGARFTRLRRMSGNGSAVWMPLQRSKDLDNPGEFEMLMRVLWRYQYIQNPVELSDEWAEYFWRKTQGIPDMMVKLWSSTQEAAIATGIETLTHRLMEGVYQAEFSMVEMPLKAMREDNRTVLAALTDLYPSGDVSESPFRLEPTRASKKRVYPSPAPIPVAVASGSASDIRIGSDSGSQTLAISRWNEGKLV